METNNEELQDEKQIEYEDLLKYTDEELYKVLFQEFLNVPYENFVKRTDEEVNVLLNKENILELIEIVAMLGQIHHNPMIKISKAVASIVMVANNETITDSQAKVVARHFYEEKKRRTNSKIEMVFGDFDEEEPSPNFGEYLKGYTDDDKEVEEICIYIENIVDGTSNKQEAIFEILNTINHEFYHAIESKNRTRSNIYDHNTLQAALDSTIYNYSDLKYHNKDYYASNYSNIVEEIKAEIYGITRTLDVLKQFPTDQYDQYIKYGERKIVQLEMIKNVNINFDDELAKSRFEVANQLASQAIKEDPAIIQMDRVLSHVYRPDGSRKSVTELINDKANAEFETLKKLLELEKIMKEKGSKKYEKRYRENKYNYNKLDMYYSEIISYAFKTMEYEEFKELYDDEQAIKQLEKSLKLILKNRETKLLENNSMLLHSMLKLSTWKKQLENLKRHVEKSKRAINKFKQYSERAMNEEKIEKTR